MFSVNHGHFRAVIGQNGLSVPNTGQTLFLDTNISQPWLFKHDIEQQRSFLPDICQQLTLDTWYWSTMILSYLPDIDRSLSFHSQYL